MQRYLIILFLGMLAGLSEVSCRKDIASSGQPSVTNQTLVSNLQDNYQFSLFYYALKKTGLDQLISGSTPYTLLIPDNNAFGRDSIRSDSDLDKLDSAYLRKWMSYHILPGSITTASVAQAVNTLYHSLSGQTLYFSKPIPGAAQAQVNINQVLHINGDTVNTVDITASNGVIQVLNRPLKLPVASVQAYLAGDPQYSFLVSALKRFGLWDQLTDPGPFTIFAPVNASFTNLGITQDSLNNLDTVHFQTSLFGIYVATPARVFLTDFSDIGAGTGSSQLFFFTPTGTSYFWQGQYGSGAGALVNLDGNTNTTIPTAWTDPDNIAVNGVVQGIDGLLLMPDQVTK